MDDDSGGMREAGSSLIGVLVVLVILGAMAAAVVATLGRDEQTATALSQLTPGGTMDSGTPAAGPIAAGPIAAGPIAASSVAACRADVATLETAMAAVHASSGTYPASLAELQASGLVGDLPEIPGLTFGPEISGGQPTGRILVNGRPADEGCHQ